MEEKHSKLGIASFVTSVVMAIVVFILIVLAGIMEASTPGGVDEESVQAIVLGLFIIASIFIAFIAFILGIAGLMQKDCKKTFAVLGMIFSASIMLGTIGLIIIGNSM